MPARPSPAAAQLARDIIGNEQDGVRQIRATYAEIAYDEASWRIEARDGRAWRESTFSAEKVAERRERIAERGRTQ